MEQGLHRVCLNVSCHYRFLYSFLHLFYFSQKVSVTPNTLGDNIDLNIINFYQCLPQYPTYDGAQQFIIEDDGWMND